VTISPTFTFFMKMFSGITVNISPFGLQQNGGKKEEKGKHFLDEEKGKRGREKWGGGERERRWRKKKRRGKKGAMEGKRVERGKGVQF
jgi:hypothetical protein